MIKTMEVDINRAIEIEREKSTRILTMKLEDMILVPRITTSKYKVLLYTGETKNMIISIVTKRYKLVFNDELLEGLATILENMGKSYRFRMYGDIRYFFGEFIFNETIEIRNGDKVRPILIAQNSYDRSLKLGVSLGLWREICENGARVSIMELQTLRRHMLGLDLDKVFDLTKTIFRIFYEEAIPLYQKMATTKFVFDDKLEQMLRKRVGKQIVERTRNDIVRTSNVWDAYNVLTRYLTHDYAEQCRASYLRQSQKLLSVDEIFSSIVSS